MPEIIAPAAPQRIDTIDDSTPPKTGKAAKPKAATAAVVAKAEDSVLELPPELDTKAAIMKYLETWGRTALEWDQVFLTPRERLCWEHYKKNAPYSKLLIPQPFIAALRMWHVLKNPIDKPADDSLESAAIY